MHTHVLTYTHSLSSYNYVNIYIYKYLYLSIHFTNQRIYRLHTILFQYLSQAHWCTVRMMHSFAWMEKLVAPPPIINGAVVNIQKLSAVMMELYVCLIM